MTPDPQPAPARRASFPPRDGNSVRVLIDGAEALGRIFAVAATARSSLWVTVSFVDLDLPVPGTSTTLLRFFEDLARSGVDVRLLFWWSEYAGIGSFRGDPEELETLRRRGSRVRMRWDAVPQGCHHQKCHVIDGELAFVGGMNLTADAMSDPSHEAGGHHDLFAELTGPAVADVATNFVQRWNQASRTRDHAHAYPSPADAADIAEHVLELPTGGAARVQVVRTIRHSQYDGAAGWHADNRFALDQGEHSVQEAVLSWIAAARQRIYLENQYLTDPETIRRLAAAARRGVEVIAVVPLEPDPNLLLYPSDKMRETRAALAELAAEDNAALFGLAHDRASRARPVYVHAKLMVLDECALMLGSANLWPPSYSRDSELNLCVWDAHLARTTSARLAAEHLGEGAVGSLESWTAAAGATTAPGSRAVQIDPRRYYEFPEGATAPWAGAKPAD